ncbi:MAG: hypothetical protein ACI9P7_001775 [Candidatus Azotimanducaceae bacterium]|jgi:hypothetical protein
MQKNLIFIILTAQCFIPLSVFAAPKDDLNRLLDGFHSAAARADFSDYFSRFAKQSVFLGTDTTERWTLEEFKTYAKPHFAKGQGWTYNSVERFWQISENVAWFDGQLDNENLGRCRGTGVAKADDVNPERHRKRCGSKSQAGDA